MDMDYNLSCKIWAKSKPYHPLERHMVDTGCMAQSLLTESCFSVLLPRLADGFSLTEEKFLRCVGFLFALHDIGKCHPLFEQKCKDLDIVKTLSQQDKLQVGDQSVYLHEVLSARIVLDLLKAANNTRPVARMWAEVIGMHHQRSHERPAPIDSRIRLFWENLQVELKSKLWDVFSCNSPCQFNACRSLETAGFLLLGLLILSDWLASSPEWFTHGYSGESLVEYMETSRQSAKTAIKRLGLTKTGILELWPDFNRVWPNIPRKSMRPLQIACETFFKTVPLPGLLVIEAPMGEGKTETAIYAGMQWIASCGLAGIYIALPTAATSNQMFDRILNFLEMHGMNNNIRLMHGMAWLVDEDTPEKVPSLENDSGIAAAWFRSSRKGLLAPWAVGTVDQAMMTALRVRFNALRLLGLSSKVLIIDEVHAYDVYMTVILERLLRWCGAMSIPVILLSATLPSGRRRALMDAYTGQKNEQTQTTKAYPLLTYSTVGGAEACRTVCDVYMKRSVQLKLWRGGLDNWEEVAQKAIDLVADGGCFCIIVNTVKEAQDLYSRFKEKKKEDLKLLLFHGRFTAGDRQRIEKLCLEFFDKRSLASSSECRPQKAILVATQVVEQSLDLDFDYMISAIAPIDLLLQRIGRLHRHSGRDRPAALQKPELLVLLPKEGGFGLTERVYEPWVLYKTLEILEEERISIEIPADLRWMVEIVYDDTEPPEDHPHHHAWEQLYRKRRKHEQEALQYLIPVPDGGAPIREEHWYEDEDGSSKWFRVHTRLGADTVQVLLLEQDELERVSTDLKSLKRAEARRLMLNLAVLPGWWLDNLRPSDGFIPLVKGAGWLKGFQLLGLQRGTFYGYRGNMEQVRLVNDPELGIYLERM